MPSTRRRYMVTETDQVSQALAAQEKQLLDQRKAAMLRTAGGLTGIYRENELELLRKDWPG